MARIDIDVADHLDEVSTEVLQREIARRIAGTGDINNHRISVSAAAQALIEASDLFRKFDRYELAFKLDEVRVDYVRN